MSLVRRSARAAPNALSASTKAMKISDEDHPVMRF